MMDESQGQKKKKRGISTSAGCLTIIIFSVLVLWSIYQIDSCATTPSHKIKTAEKVFPNDPKILFTKADEEVRKGNYDLAINYYQMILNKFPESDEAKASRSLLTSTREAKKKSDEESRIKSEKMKKRSMGLLWSYSKNSDSMTGNVIKSAYIKSVNEIDFKFSYMGKQRAELILRIHPRYGKDVILEIEKGQFLCGIRSCQIIARFDNGKPLKFSAVEPEDHSTTSLFIKDYSRFITNIKHSKKLIIEAQFFQEGTRTFEFDVEGLDPSKL